LPAQHSKSGKHVLVEKPLTTSVAEAEQLIEIAERNHRVLMVDHTFVYTGAVRKIKEIVSSGDLGICCTSMRRVSISDSFRMTSMWSGTSHRTTFPLMDFHDRQPSGNA